jgi:hypothetical protein
MDEWEIAIHIIPTMGTKSNPIPSPGCVGRYSRDQWNRIFLGQSLPKPDPDHTPAAEQGFSEPTHVAIKSLLFRCYTAVISLLINAVILGKIKKQQRLIGWMRCDIDRNSGREHHPSTAQSRGSPGAGGVMSGSAALAGGRVTLQCLES